MKTRYKDLIAEIEDLLEITEMASIDEGFADELGITKDQAVLLSSYTATAFNAIDDALTHIGWVEVGE